MFRTKLTATRMLELARFTSTKVNFQFYFPVAGQFTHSGSNVAVDQVVVAKGPQNIIQVESQRRITKVQSFDDLIAIGSKQDVLRFLETENLNSAAKNFSFDKILHLMKDPHFFNQTIDILR